MKIWLYTVTRNEAKIMPWFLRHYEQFCDRITVIDDASDDGTQDIVRACPKAVLESYPHSGGLDDREMLAFATAKYREVRGHAHWCIWVDSDEFLYHPELLPTLERLRLAGVEVPLMRGYQMLSNHFPQITPPRFRMQITDLVTEGVEDPTYGKPCLFMPHVEMNWELGKHYVHPPPGGRALIRGEYAGLKLLHYRCLGMDYLRERHARNYARCSAANKAGGLGIGVYPGWTGHMSEPWFQAIWERREKII